MGELLGMDEPELPAVHDRLIGKTVGGRYRLLSRLGSGGMSTVYLARHVLIDRLMAIKTLRAELATDPVQRDRFLREARAVNRINHENIVEITDFGETDAGLLYLVMEHVPGKPLVEVVQHGALELWRAFHIARQCAVALARAHQMGVVHRDLKPENVLLMHRRGDPDFVKVLDFGIAKILDAPSLTASQQIFGTPGYIAPEYIQSTEIDGRADLYSLGVILYELVTGALPFDYEYPGDLLLKHVNEMPVAPSERLASVPRPVEEFLLRCLRKDPSRRFRDAYHFLEELEAVADATSGSASAVAGGRPTLPPATIAEAAAPGVSTADSSRTDNAVNRPVGVSAPAIPKPPSHESVDGLVTAASGLSGKDRVSATPFDPGVDGIMGVRRWRRRFDVLATLLDSVAPTGEGVPAAVKDAMGTTEATLRELEKTARTASARQLHVEALQDRLRDIRGVLGQRIDGLAGHLSHLRGDLERRRMEPASRTPRVESEASLWAHAASDAELQVVQRQVECSEIELDRLRDELERRSAEGEAELERESAMLDAEMTEVEQMSRALREPLDVAERFVLADWRGWPGPQSR